MRQLALSVVEGIHEKALLSSVKFIDRLSQSSNSVLDRSKMSTFLNQKKRRKKKSQHAEEESNQGHLIQDFHKTIQEPAVRSRHF